MGWDSPPWLPSMPCALQCRPGGTSLSPPGPSVWSLGQGALLAAQGSGVQSGSFQTCVRLRPQRSGSTAPLPHRRRHSWPGRWDLRRPPGGAWGRTWPGHTAATMAGVQGGEVGGRPSSPTVQTLPVLSLTLTREVRGWVLAEQFESTWRRFLSNTRTSQVK